MLRLDLTAKPRGFDGHGVRLRCAQTVAATTTAIALLALPLAVLAPEHIKAPVRP